SAAAGKEIPTARSRSKPPIATIHTKIGFARLRSTRECDNRREMSLVQQIDTLFQEQTQSWPRLARGVEGLAHAQTRPVRIGWFDVFIRHIPHRVLSTTAAVDRESIAKRPCFLCAGNLDPEERGIPFNPDYTVYCNPFPIVDRHLTIVH